MQLGKYILSNTHGSKVQTASLTLRLNGDIVAQCWPKAYNPLKYVREHSKGKLAREFLQQMAAANVCESVIADIFTVRGND